MIKKDAAEIENSDDIARFTESYFSFNKIINKVQRQYLSLKEAYERQSEEFQSVNRTLQSLVVENRAVTEFLNSILYALSSGVIAVDRRGRVTHINPAARSILGLPDTLNVKRGVRYNEIIVSAGEEAADARQAIARGTGFENAEKKVKTGYGTIVTLLSSASLLRRHDSEVVGAVELFHDISRVKRMEEQLSCMKALASLGEMAASIAHEIRNPLVGVSGFASLLARDLKDDAPKRDMARKIVDGVNSINNTIQTLLDFARHEKIDRTPVDLIPYLNLVIDNFAAEHPMEGDSREILREYDTWQTIMVDIDRQLFRRALYNLIKNGFEAGGREPLVAVNCRELPPLEAQEKYGSRLEISGAQSLAAIEIEDNGPGIPEDKVSEIFSPFFSTKENGTGLGLAISWKIVKAHGGDITAESPGRNGTRFTIVLPARQKR